MQIKWTIKKGFPKKGQAQARQQGKDALVIETCVVDFINSWIVNVGGIDHVYNYLQRLKKTSYLDDNEVDIVLIVDVAISAKIMGIMELRFRDSKFILEFIFVHKVNTI